ncbi:cobalamin B12-binding domain-containing protein [Heliorestis convoluta]|uniref:Cobalamin B12-binding domain-containing protein n=1 Tax=Heliorestis convoluta TaxID=356322 RepID=A0A5Q2MXT5_9FIRM|nr:cobalamin-dependent protein [Heliorestis convoluta]QGG47614.1 cobalamin B12-binding domain-containing protein [Heliorestis convoluta]
MTKNRMIEEFKIALLSMNHLYSRELLQGWVRQFTAMEVIEELIVPVMHEIGIGFEEGEVALSQVYMTSRLCEELVQELLPVAKVEYKKEPRLGIAVIADQHLLGKRIVAATLRGAGYYVHDYGGGLLPEELAQKVMDDRIDILLLSSLMLHSALRIKEVKAELLRMNYSIPIVVGGAPFTFDSLLWQKVGADSMAKTASDALMLVKKWEKEMSMHG